MTWREDFEAAREEMENGELFEMQVRIKVEVGPRMRFAIRPASIADTDIEEALQATREELFRMIHSLYGGEEVDAESVERLLQALESAPWSTEEL